MRTFFIFFCFLIAPRALADSVVLGTKIFTESYILGEIAAQKIENSSQISIVRKPGMGSTGVLFQSLKSGAIDIYPDYTGTIAETILKNPKLKSIEEINLALDALGLTISGSLGFNNTYALAVSESVAKKYDLDKISDLEKIGPAIRVAFSYEFMNRQDGYRGMVQRYPIHFAPEHIKSMEHSLVYQAISEGAVDLIEVYSTDANIQKYKLHVLKDNLNYFPAYRAVWVARKDFVDHHPDEWKSLTSLEGKIDEDKMISLNALADLEKISFSEIASKFLGSKRTSSQNGLHEIPQRTSEHLFLVLSSLIFSILVGIPLGIFAARHRRGGQLILLFSALVQTIPALALLCFLIPVFGIGLKPALVALCLYSLLPVVLNTFTAIESLDKKHLENAKAFGMTPLQILFRIELPLGSPIILAGVKAATIVSVGTATLAALVGAGGYGALIVSGLSLNDIPSILSGAIPAAIMALIAHLIFGIIGKWIVPRGLQKAAQRLKQ